MMLGIQLIWLNRAQALCNRYWVFLRCYLSDFGENSRDYKKVQFVLDCVF